MAISWVRFKQRTKSVFRFLFVESVKGTVTYYATKKGVEDGGDNVAAKYTKRF